MCVCVGGEGRGEGHPLVGMRAMMTSGWPRHSRRVTVYDWDLADIDDKLGLGEVELKPLLSSSSLTTAVKLKNAKRAFKRDEDAGTVHLRLEWRLDQPLDSFQANLAARTVARVGPPARGPLAPVPPLPSATWHGGPLPPSAVPPLCARPPRATAAVPRQTRAGTRLLGTLAHWIAGDSMGNEEQYAYGAAWKERQYYLIISDGPKKGSASARGSCEPWPRRGLAGPRLGLSRAPLRPLHAEEAVGTLPSPRGAAGLDVPRPQDEAVSLGRLYQLYQMDELKSNVKVWRVDGGDRWRDLGSELDAALAEQGEP